MHEWSRLVPLRFIWRHRKLLSVICRYFAEVESRKRRYHTDDIWVLQVRHDLDLLEVAMLVDFVRELFLLQRDRLNGVNLAVSAAPDLANNAESATSQQLLHLEVISCQVRAIHYRFHRCDPSLMTRNSHRVRPYRFIIARQAGVPADHSSGSILQRRLSLA